MRTHVALFAGMGGFIAAANRVGLETIFANDVEGSCFQTLSKNFSTNGKGCEIEICGRDIRDIRGVEIDKGRIAIDILSAGFPCQSFSQAGENKGFEDERGMLFFEIPRLCKEFHEFPKILVLENVKHLKTFNGGERLAIIIDALREIGYWVREESAVVIDSAKVAGSPQSRKRLFIVAYHSKYFKRNHFKMNVNKKTAQKSIWEIVDKSIKQDDYLYLDPDNKYYRKIEQSIKEKGDNRLHQIRRVESRACAVDNCPTLTANMGGGGHNVPFLRDMFGIRRLSTIECFELQGYKEQEVSFPDELSDFSKLSMIGNSVHVDVVEKIFRNIDLCQA